ncbi:MAG: hypothetical protein IKO43_00540, partial [Kiritimatiellae bacterium]|nr:hypothetical protein [Kiritimatiellia bacterium]
PQQPVPSPAVQPAPPPPVQPPVPPTPPSHSISPERKREILDDKILNDILVSIPGSIVTDLR